MTCEYIDRCTLAETNVQLSDEDIAAGYSFHLFFYLQRDDVASYTMDVDVSNTFYDAFGSNRCDGYYIQNQSQQCDLDDFITSIDSLLTTTPSIDSDGIISIEYSGMDSVTQNYGQIG